MQSAKFEFCHYERRLIRPEQSFEWGIRQEEEI